MKKRYLLLEDDAGAVGGTALTLTAITRPRHEQVFYLPTACFNRFSIIEHSDKIWILGNIMHLHNINPYILQDLTNSVRLVKIEFDYNYCPFRGDVSHQRFANEPCNCPSHKYSSPLTMLYNGICEKAAHMFFMSDGQRNVYRSHLPSLPPNSVLSSCFLQEHLALFTQLRNTSKNGKYAVFQGNGGWHSEAKGLQPAIDFCKANQLDFDVLPNAPYDEHVRTLSKYYGVVFMPIIHDTCPRCIIEAKLMGLKVITNDNSQHIPEDWWQSSIENMSEYLAGRPEYFWRTLDNIF